MIKIAITDDHKLVLEGMKSLLGTVDHLKVIATYSNIKETIDGLNETEVDILFLDINLPDGNGIKACKSILQTHKDLKIVALTNFEETTFLKQMIKNGARGYLLKNTTVDEIVEAIEQVYYRSEVFIPSGLKQQLIDESFGKMSTSFIPKLTRREKEVLELIAKEHTTEEMAEILFVSPKTIEAHRSNLIQKLGVRNTAEVLRVAFEKGLL